MPKGVFIPIDQCNLIIIARKNLKYVVAIDDRNSIFFYSKSKEPTNIVMRTLFKARKL